MVTVTGMPNTTKGMGTCTGAAVGCGCVRLCAVRWCVKDEVGGSEVRDEREAGGARGAEGGGGGNRMNGTQR